MTQPQSQDTPLSPNGTGPTELPSGASTTSPPSVNPSNSLVAALAKAQGQFPEIAKDRTVKVKPRSGGQEYEFRYATLGAIIKAVKKPLSDNGVFYTQILTYDPISALYYLETRLMLGDEEISSSVPLIVGEGAGNQQLGSALTYMRRYALAAILGIVADEDDDGNWADGNEVRAMADSVAKNAPKKPAPDPISSGNRAREEYIKAEARRIYEENPETINAIAEGLKDAPGFKKKVDNLDKLLDEAGFTPVKVDVPMLHDDTHDWMTWGKRFMEQARLAPNLKALADLEAANEMPLKNMELYQKKMFANLSVALIKVRKELEKS